MLQTQLPLAIVSKGRFDKSEPTLHRGEDLDVPTFIRRGIAPDFVSHKHHLDRVAAMFPAERMVHIGDTFVDAHYARLHGFEFFFATEVPAPGTAGWIF